MDEQKRILKAHNIITVKKLGDHCIKVTELSSYRCTIPDDMDEFSSLPFFEPTEKKPDKRKKDVAGGKLENHICRAKTKVHDLILCNPWDYWCTFTLSPEKYDRHNLQRFTDDFTEFIHSYNRRCADADKVRYIFVPEQHKDGAWHLHGFIRGIRKTDVYTNKYGYLAWRQYENKFGYISMSKIKDVDRASSYMLKYMTKDIGQTTSRYYKHLYFASRGLQKPKLLFQGHARLLCDWDWVHPDGYCKIKNFDSRETDVSEMLEIL